MARVVRKRLISVLHCPFDYPAEFIEILVEGGEKAVGSYSGTVSVDHQHLALAGDRVLLFIPDDFLRLDGDIVVGIALMDGDVAGEYCVVVVGITYLEYT